jgi:hypothetical protein
VGLSLFFKPPRALNGDLPRLHRSAQWVFTNYENKTGFESKSYVYMLGTLFQSLVPPVADAGFPARLGSYVRRFGHGGLGSYRRRHQVSR